MVKLGVVAVGGSDGEGQKLRGERRAFLDKCRSESQASATEAQNSRAASEKVLIQGFEDNGAMMMTMRTATMGNGNAIAENAAFNKNKSDHFVKIEDDHGNSSGDSSSSSSGTTTSEKDKRRIADLEESLQSAEAQVATARNLVSTFASCQELLMQMNDKNKSLVQMLSRVEHALVEKESINDKLTEEARTRDDFVKGLEKEVKDWKRQAKVSSYLIARLSKTSSNEGRGSSISSSSS
jgi:uncharacterized membrane-anchored protein YhcB (DUF1043 family)